MANRRKGIFQLAALMVVTGCGNSPSTSRQHLDTSAPKLAVTEFATAFSNERYTYNQYLERFGSFKPTTKLKFRGRLVLAFDYGALGHCFAIDNREYVGLDDPKKRPIAEFECLMDGPEVRLTDLARVFGEVFLSARPIDETVPLEKVEALSLPAGHHAYQLG